MKILRNKYFPLFCILAVSVLMRFTLLNTIPTAINGDELVYPLTAKSVYLTGRDVTGTWNPLSVLFFRYPPGEKQAELPYFLHFLFSAPLPFSLIAIKLPYAILSTGTVVLLYMISGKLLGPQAAIATGLLAAVNPWLVVMGRTAFESTPATFFYLLSLYMLLTVKTWKIIVSVIPLFFAFYSYIGTKLIFIPFVAISLYLRSIIDSSIHKKYFVVIGVCSVCITGLFFLLTVSNSTQSRLSELLLPNAPIFSEQVNRIRSTSIQSPLLPIFINKFTVYIDTIINKLLNVLSAAYLFKNGDQFFLPASHSFFYILDAIVLFFGLFSVYAHNRRIGLALVLFILIGTIPQVFHTTMGDFSVHNTLMFPFLLLFMGYGISELVRNSSGNYRVIVISTIAVFYIVMIANFAFIYLFQYPLKGAGDFHIRVLSRYLILNSAPGHVYVYSNTGSELLKRYIFYTDNMISADEVQQLNYSLSKRSLTHNNVTFLSCDTGLDTLSNRDIHIVDTACGRLIHPASHIQIARLSDGGSIYEIYNDTSCTQYTLNSYPTGLKISDFNVENMDAQQFCKTFISR